MPEKVGGLLQLSSPRGGDAKANTSSSNARSCDERRLENKESAI